MKTFFPRFRKALPVLLITAALALSLSAWGLWKYRFSRLEAPLKPLCINELSVSSLATQVGGSTIYEDYIELYNPNNNTISLDGLHAGPAARCHHRPRRSSLHLRRRAGWLRA